MNKLFIFLAIIYFYSKPTFAQSELINSKVNIFKKELTPDQQKNWQHKDITLDSIPGISIDRAYTEVIKYKKGNEITVAIIDMETDINHEDLAQSIWINKREIPDNGIDDDKNGYIDDIHGWNFLGNKKGESVFSNSIEAVRIVRKFKGEFDGKKQELIEKSKLTDFLLYQKALLSLEEYKKDDQKDIDYIDRASKGYYSSIEMVKKYFPKGDYNIKKLDSLINLFQDDKVLVKKIANMKDIINYNITEKWLDDYRKNLTLIQKTTNLEYNDRELIGDNVNDINDKKYGNNNISKNATFLKHGTEICGILSANRENKIGIKGFSDDIKIMTLAISAYGDENDKDIALAIYYAVNNGAKVINMSFGKSMSINQKWVLNAIKYAESKNVLIVAGAGNGAQETNFDNPHYPSDNDFIKKEVSNNYIVVGGVTNQLNDKFVASFSNYSKNNVDIFAPANNIYTTQPESKYAYDSGTSLAAPMVSGTAALIWLYYPKLTAAQVKQIIMDSGVAYDIEVIVPGTTDKKVKFSELSKSGKVVNVYNAMIMAKKMSNE
jgi:cell wall-associated protease